MACESKLDVKIDDLTPRLVVEGYVSNEQKPVEVRLSWTANYGYDSYTPMVSGALVCLLDNRGNCVDLPEREEGVYSTAGTGFRALAGHSYAIQISLPDGRSYSSVPELLPSSLGIDSAYFEYFRREQFGPTGYTEMVPAIQLYADIPNSPAERDYLLWKWEGTFEFVPPLADRSFSCWVTETENYKRFNLFTDDFYEDSRIKNLEIDIIDVDFKFGVKYVVEIQQYTIGSNAYEYFKGLKHQLERNGSFSDPSPYRVIGNIKNQEDADEVVLGYFYAAGVSSRHLAVKRVDIPLSTLKGGPHCDPPFFGGPPIECTSCEAYTNKSFEPPVFW